MNQGFCFEIHQQENQEWKDIIENESTGVKMTYHQG